MHVSYPGDPAQASYHAPAGDLGGVYGGWYIVCTISQDLGGGYWRGVQVASDPMNGSQSTYIRYKHDSNWSKWQRVATAIPPQVYDLPLVYGWSVETPAAVPWYSKNQFGEVTVNIKAKSTENKNGCPLAKLPEGYRPKVGYEISVPCSFVLDDYSRGVGHIDFGSSGDINFYPDNTLNNPIRTLFCPTAVFQAA